MPDLILIDGGRGQLNAALAALAGLGRRGDADRRRSPSARRRSTCPARPEPLRLPRDDAGLQLLQQVRDEAHRFAIGRHRRRRSARSFASRMEEIPGIGPERRRTLSLRYGTWERLAEATLEELVELLGPKLGERVRGHLAAAAEALDSPKE